MIRLDKHGRVLSGGFNGESLPSYADEVTHGLGEAKPAGEKVRSLMARLSAKRKEKVKQSAVKAAIQAQSKQAFKNLVAARRLSEQAAKARKLEAAKAKVRVAASKQRSIGFDFSGLIGDPLAGFDETATILASSGLLGEGLYDDVIEGEDFGNTMLGAAPKKAASKKTPVGKMPVGAAQRLEAAGSQVKAIRSTFDALVAQRKKLPKGSPEEQAKTREIEEFYKKNIQTNLSMVLYKPSVGGGFQTAYKHRNAEDYIKAIEEKKKDDDKIALAMKLGVTNDPNAALRISDKQLAELVAKKKAEENFISNVRKKADTAAKAKLPVANRTKVQEALYHIFFIQSALDQAKTYHDTNIKFKKIVTLVEKELRELDKKTDKLSGKERKDGDNNRNYIKNEFEKAKVKAIERTIDWRKKNGKCGILGLDCVYPPNPLLIIGAVALVVGTIATGGALLTGIASVASSVGSATAGVAGTVGGVAGSAASAVGLGAIAPVATTLGTTAAAGVIGKAGEALIPKEVKEVTQVAGVVSGASSGGSIPSAGDLASSGLKAAQAEGERRVQGAVKEAASFPERKIAEEQAKAKAKVEHAKKLPKKVKDKAIADTKANAKKLAVADVAKKTGLPVASIQAVADGKTPPTPVIPSVAELAQKEVKATQEVALATLQEKTGIQTGVENPVWSAKDIAEEVSPQALKAGGFAPVQAQAKLANAAEGLGVQIADKPDLSLSREDRNRLAAEVAKSEQAVLTEKYNAVMKAGKNLELAKASNLPAASIKTLELQYAEAVAQYDKAKLASGVRVAAAAQGRLDDSYRHPMARFF